VIEGKTYPLFRRSQPPAPITSSRQSVASVKSVHSWLNWFKGDHADFTDLRGLCRPCALVFGGEKLTII